MGQVVASSWDIYYRFTLCGSVFILKRKKKKTKPFQWIKRLRRNRLRISHIIGNTLRLVYYYMSETVVSSSCRRVTTGVFEAPVYDNEMIATSVICKYIVQSSLAFRTIIQLQDIDRKVSERNEQFR